MVLAKTSYIMLVLCIAFAHKQVGCFLDDGVCSFRNVSQSLRRRSSSHTSPLRSPRGIISNGGDPSLLRFMLVEQNLPFQQSLDAFSTIQAAIDAVPSGNQHWVVIQVGPGIYREKIMIPYSKPFIILQGSGRDLSTILWSDSASQTGMANSATFTCFASNFIAKYISFKNGAPPPPPGAQNMQAVAALIGGDMAAFYSCGFFGAQDTLFDYQGRHYYRDCYIEGSIDFIFGHAQSVFRGCELHAIAQTAGSLTAHNRDNPRETSGFIFIACSVTGTGPVYLGRAWGAYSRVVFLFTYMDNVILPQGWSDWGVPSRQQTVFYGQYKCFGPGANEQGRVRWSHELSDEEARHFLKVSFINGVDWLPGV